MKKIKKMILAGIALSTLFQLADAVLVRMR